MTSAMSAEEAADGTRTTKKRKEQGKARCAGNTVAKDDGDGGAAYAVGDMHVLLPDPQTSAAAAAAVAAVSVHTRT